MYLVEYSEAFRNKDLDYLGEYLIEKQFLTLSEAKNLLEVAKADKSKIKAAIEKKFDAIWKKIEVDAAKTKKAIEKRYKSDPKKLKAALKKLDAKIKYKGQNWTKAKKFALKNADTRFGKMKSQIVTAYRMLPKSGKVGLGIAAGTAAAGAGYAGYRAATKKK